MIALPPLLAGGENVTSSERFRLVAPTPTGGSGTASAGTAVFEAADCGPVPAELVAVTRQVYVRPLVRPLTMIGLPLPVAEPLAPPFDDTHDAV